MSRGISILAIIAVIVVAIGAFVASGINTIPTMKADVDAKWANVQSDYQRRADLVPNLVETVKGYAKQEEKVLTEVVEARAKATGIRIDASTINDPEKLKQIQEAQSQLSGALGRLIAVSENYPDLKSNQNFLTLQSQLEGTENRINVSRKDYNESVRIYNTELTTFPGRIFRAIFYSSNNVLPTFTAAPESQAAPKVDFGN